LLAPRDNDWRMIKFNHLQSVVQFCDLNCMTTFFEQRIAEAKMKMLKS